MCSENPCSQTTTTESCYDNCGCLNPTTFICTTYTGPDLINIGFTANDLDNTGNGALLAIDTALGLLQSAKGKVVVDDNDNCPENLISKLSPGTNISFQVVGTGCDRKIRIDSTTGGVPVDVNVKASLNDTTSDYLSSKIDTGAAISKNILNPSGNEKVKLDIIYSQLLSTDSGNMLTVGSDGKIKTSFLEPDGSETKVIEGSGATVTGTGTALDPYIISTNPSIQALRPCFDGVWRDVTLVSIGNTSVTLLSGSAKYRYRHDGSIEFKGSVSFTVAFGNYASSTRKHTVTLGNIPTTCLSLAEQGGTVDMKSINYIDTPQASSDQITQQYGYVIRKSAQNVILEFQSSFTNNTTKTIVVNFDGAIQHPAF